MAIELATALVRVRVDRPGLAIEINWARRAILRGLSGIRINVGVSPASLAATRRAIAGAGAGGGPALGGGGRANRSSLGGMLAGGNISGFMKGSAQIAFGIVGAQAALAALRFPAIALRDAAEFEKEMIRVKTISEATEDEFESMTATAIKMGQTTQFSAIEAAKALGIMAQQGMKASAMSSALPTVLNFASAGKIDPEEAANTLLGISNAMEIPVSRMEEVADILARAEFKSLANIHDLGEAFKYVGPLGEMTSQSLTNVAAALSLLSNAKLGGSVGGTGFKRILSDMLNPKVLAKMDKLTGKKLSLHSEGGGLKAMPDILDEVNAAFGENGTKAEKAAFAMQVFGQRAGPQFAILLNKGGDALRQMERDLGDVGITAASVAGKQLETMAGAGKRLMNTIQTVSIKAIMPMSKAIQALANSFANLISNALESPFLIAAFGAIGEAVMAIVDGARAFFALNSEWIRTTVQVALLTGGLAASAMAVLGLVYAATSLSAVLLSLAGTPLGATLLGLMAITAALVDATVEGETFAQKMKHVFGTLLPALLDNAAFFFRNFTKIVELSGVQWELFIIDAVTGMEEVFERLAVTVIAIWDGLGAAFAAFIANVRGGLAEIGNIANAIAIGIQTGSLEEAMKAFAAQPNVEGGGNPFQKFKQAFDKTKGEAEEGFKDNPLGEALRLREKKLLDEIAALEAERARRANVGLPPSPPTKDSGSGAPQADAGGFKSKLIGIEELHKQIQVGLAEKDKDKTQKQIAKASEATATNTATIASDLKNLTSRFA